MEPKLIQKIFTDTAYVRTGGSPEELKAAEYIRDICTSFGATATIEEFDVQMATMHTDTHHGIVAPELDDLFFFLEAVQHFIVHKMIIHTVPLSRPDGPGGVKNDLMKIQLFLFHQFPEDRILSRRTFSHYIKNLSH